MYKYTPKNELLPSEKTYKEVFFKLHIIIFESDTVGSLTI